VSPVGDPKGEGSPNCSTSASLSTYEPCGPKRTCLPVAAVDNIIDDAAR
jgi:hypothetical protein